jgi:hypothetical protein
MAAMGRGGGVRCFLFFYAMSYYFVEGAAGSVVALRLVGVRGARGRVTGLERPA